jgi:hypothetical protein
MVLQEDLVARPCGDDPGVREHGHPFAHQTIIFDRADGVTDSAHAIAVELGSRAAVHPLDTDNFVAAGRKIQKHALLPGLLNSASASGGSRNLPRLRRALMCCERTSFGRMSGPYSLRLGSDVESPGDLLVAHASAIRREPHTPRRHPYGVGRGRDTATDPCVGRCEKGAHRQSVRNR